MPQSSWNLTGALPLQHSSKTSVMLPLTVAPQPTSLPGKSQTLAQAVEEAEVVAVVVEETEVVVETDMVVEIVLR